MKLRDANLQVNEKLKHCPEVFWKKVFLEISQKSQESACARVSFLMKLQAGLQFY